MPIYQYRLKASRELNGEQDTLTGIITTHHALTYNEIREQAIDSSPRDYIHFADLDVEVTP